MNGEKEKKDRDPYQDKGRKDHPKDDDTSPWTRIEKKDRGSTHDGGGGGSGDDESDGDTGPRLGR